ncbi:hypothetical protein GCM10023183_37860 [Nibribacter koreensis]|uniref:Lipocalin-like domain-containing protein n=2 Tax=Nibribacter koreensis TaxID=1084519 RepID=A0ABP8G487_9BACT
MLILLLTIIASALSSCGDTEKDPEPSREELLTEREWKVSRVYLNGQDVTSRPEMASVRGTRASYRMGGTYTETSGSGAVTVGTWQLSAGTLTLRPVTTQEESWRVEELGKGRLTMSTTLVMQDGASVLFRLELVHV